MNKLKILQPSNWIVLLIMFALIGVGIGWNLANENANRKMQEDKDSDKKTLYSVVVKSSELYNLSELKYTTLARETSQCQLSNKVTGLALDNVKDKQTRLLLELKSLMKQLGIEQDLIPVPKTIKDI